VSSLDRADRAGCSGCFVSRTDRAGCSGCSVGRAHEAKDFLRYIRECFSIKGRLRVHLKVLS